MNNQVIGNIILESSQEVPEVTIIAEKNNKVTGTGIIQTIADENRNGRIYELKDMKPEVCDIKKNNEESIQDYVSDFMNLQNNN